jgi:hypothetical protein
LDALQLGNNVVVWVEVTVDVTVLVEVVLIVEVDVDDGVVDDVVVMVDVEVDVRVVVTVEVAVEEDVDVIVVVAVVVGDENSVTKALAETDKPEIIRILKLLLVTFFCTAFAENKKSL